ncbi:MAG: ABC transporter permease [Alphaproteobacteria bacterium]|nr:ABC transporter permease [Alphaproteobacteria bacterium]
MPRAAIAEGLRALLLLWLASLAAFAVVRAMPADPAVLSLVAFGQAADPDTVAALHREWGLDQALPLQYAAWLGDFVAGDWRRSFKTGAPILDEFAKRLPVSLIVGFGGLFVALLAVGPLARGAAKRPHGWAARVLDAATLGAQAIPAFWLGCLLLWFFAVELRVIDVLGEGPARYVLPILIVAFTGLGPLAQVYRAGLAEVSRADYFRTALAKGADPDTALEAQGGRYARLGLSAALTAEAGWVVGGTAVVEVVFGLPGLGTFLVDSIAMRDYFVLQAYIVVAAAWMLAIAFVAAGARHLLDPRLR